MRLRNLSRAAPHRWYLLGVPWTHAREILTEQRCWYAQYLTPPTNRQARRRSQSRAEREQRGQVFGPDTDGAEINPAKLRDDVLQRQASYWRGLASRTSVCYNGGVIAVPKK